MAPPPLPEGPHCLRCKHREACVLPQKAEGRTCPWYNRDVGTLVRPIKPRHRLKAVGS